jgi:putative hydrolase of HD superfamily
VRPVGEWIESARKGLKTETARKVAEAALTLSPMSWRGR